MGYGQVDGNFLELDNRTKVAWQNLRGQMSVAGVSNPPTTVAYRGIPLNNYGPDTMCECAVIFHIPHDYVVGTDIYPHGHVLTSTASTGVVRWGFDLTYAQEFDANVGGTPTAGNAFFAPVTAYVNMTMQANYQDVHLLMEDPAPVTLPGLGPDSLILMRVFRDAPNVADTYPDGVFLMNVDLYYQSQGFGTAAR